MKTTKLLQEADVQEAAQIIRAGGLVGMPTETVYGLGANGLDPAAVARIFEAKGRPQDNPLILHIADPVWLERYCRNIPQSAYLLAYRFWPGPLTMVLSRRSNVPNRTTGGLDTVGMRCPSHPIALRLIREADVPIAAPSGNTSGKPSPTTAQHMLEDMDGKIDAILDGVICFDEYQDLFSKQVVETLGAAENLEEQARRLFDALRAFDHTEAAAIWAQCPDCKGIGLAITNRLNKAAGFHIVEV